jgi:hypothetical protein
MEQTKLSLKQKSLTSLSTMRLALSLHDLGLWVTTKISGDTVMSLTTGVASG